MPIHLLQLIDAKHSGILQLLIVITVWSVILGAGLSVVPYSAFADEAAVASDLSADFDDEFNDESDQDFDDEFGASESDDAASASDS